MKKILFAVILITSSLMGEYIEQSEKYSLIKRTPDSYMSVVDKLYKNKVYSMKELKEALQKDDIHPLSDYLRVLAYDEYSNVQKIKQHLKHIKFNSSIIKKTPLLALSMADVLLRIGEFDKVLKLISREELVALPKKQKYQGYYYRGLAKYFKNNKISDEFLIIKYRFKVTKEIHNKIINQKYRDKNEK